MCGAVYLSQPCMADGPEFLSAVSKSVGMHHPWVAPPACQLSYASYIKRLAHEAHFGFFIRLKASDDLVGVVNINEVVRGVFQSGYLGYYAFDQFAGQGLMKAGMRQVLDDAFGRLGLHRLEANIQPKNISSIEFIKKMGFRYEGFSKNYLNIQGHWSDHERYAMVCEDYRLGLLK